MNSKWIKRLGVLLLLLLLVFQTAACQKTAGQGDTEAVSYTHLDVYKRQVRIHAVKKSRYCAICTRTVNRHRWMRSCLLYTSQKHGCFFYEGKYFQFLLSFQNSITLRINVAVSQALCRASAEGKDGCTGFLPGRWSTDLPFLKCIPTQKVTLCS